MEKENKQKFRIYSLITIFFIILVAIALTQREEKELTAKEKIERMKKDFNDKK